MEREEWKVIYQMYQKPLFLYALSLTKNVHDAEDLLQETFVKAFLSYRSTGSIKYWLVTVLKNEYLNLLKKRKREVPEETEKQEGESGRRYRKKGKQESSSDKEEVIQILIHQEERRKLFYAIQNLPLMQKEILMESVYFHLSDDTIADMHGITKENVRKIRSRAKQKLITQLKEES